MHTLAGARARTGMRGRGTLAVGVALAALAAGTATACVRAKATPEGVAARAAEDSAAGGERRDVPRREATVATDAEFAQRGGVARAEELMIGRFPGVDVREVAGQGISIRIRGANSFLGSSEPLYVVDGFPLPADGNGLLQINPHDIAKIEVLKDPAQLAEYGSRGGNGVVRIWTKRAPKARK